jgi:hypothetical protein
MSKKSDKIEQTSFENSIAIRIKGSHPSDVNGVISCVDDDFLIQFL